MAVISGNEGGKPGRQTLSALAIFFVALVFGALACDQTNFIGGGSKPTSTITAPPTRSTFHEGEDIAVESVSTDAKGVALVELIVDGQIVHTDAPSKPQAEFTLAQMWKATPGNHTIVVKSYNTQNRASDLVAISIQVSAGPVPSSTPSSATATITPAGASTSTIAPATPTPTTASTGCTNSSAFVADVSVPDGTVVAVGVTVSKKWRLLNNGTCAWGTGYQFVFTGGEALTPSTAIGVPSTAPGATVDLAVPITAPTVPGSHSGNWRMRSSSAAFFGVTVSVKIMVPSAAAAPTVTNPGAPCNGTPNIESFTASATTINVGSSTTLQWGAVTNADAVEIDQGVGGVATPGSVSVSPGSTINYTLIARCKGVTKTTQLTVMVIPIFIVSSVSGVLNPPAFSGNCSDQRNFIFAFTISASGPGTANWIIERSSRVTISGSTTFSAGGQVEVDDTWSASSSMFGWERLHVTYPNDMTSSQVTFTAVCP